MLNKVQIIGRLGKDPEVKATNGGKSVANLSVATTEKWVDKDGKKQEKTEWHRVVMFGNLADIAGKYLSKGRLVYIEGKLQTRSWESDGENKYATEIIVSQLKMLGDNESAKPSLSENDFTEEYPF